ncbi:gluconate 2-dehydrogenase subunit 3 family protein [Paenibacillus sp. Soil724D2]|uniref:gluconate 2-dehydrogenase subunit 3 family protein n=1 Tax=Paenibacillus sp. (strain Soil724D2) TaxID=1736392 RepID=UPI000714A7BE|nr:gluconate 2-dehydrogenase subunit 3 family protein [Paenibacillus sp. Soil724D2]KRE49197.1 hypothetical protein ASG85_25070 [Paenibacillus sp. Soil724D2]
MSRSNGSKGTGDIYIKATFQAVVDTIIPPTLRQVEVVGTVPAAGAVQLCVDEFVMNELDHSQFVPVNDEHPIQMPLSRSTAQLLDRGAEQLIRRGLAQLPLNPWFFHGGGPFSALSREDRLQTLALLDQLEIPLHLVPPPYQNNPGMIQTMIDSLSQLTMFGYYSEWYGYGTTRLFPPDYRQVEFFPPGWRLADYPGPAFGYRDFRGFLLKYPHAKGEYPSD